MYDATVSVVVHGEVNTCPVLEVVVGDTWQSVLVWVSACVLHNCHQDPLVVLCKRDLSSCTR